MKLNKEIKKGDKIWLYGACLSEREFFTVTKVRKVKTLVEVVVSASFFKKQTEIVMYGHCSSSLLSGYDRRFFNRPEIGYTCDYELIKEKTRKYERDQKYIDAGIALLNVAKYFK